MPAKYRIVIIIACVLLIAASFLIFGLPYSGIGSAPVLAGYNVTAGCGRGDQPTNGQLITISHQQPIYDRAGGDIISSQGTVLTLTPGTTAWLIGQPVNADGKQWQELCMATTFWVQVPY